jgi:TolA-binding protein
MSNSKYKVTGFARFFLFMVIFVPSVLSGVSFYKYGTVNLESIKKVLSNEPLEQSNEVKIQQLEKEIEQLEAKIDDKRAQLNQLRED